MEDKLSNLGKLQIVCTCEGEGEVAVFSAKHWDHRSSKALIESATPHFDAQVVGPPY